MLRVSAAVALLSIAAWATGSFADDPAKPPAQPAPAIDPGLVIDPDWRPRPGDTGYAYSGRGDTVAASPDLDALAEFIQASKARDVRGGRDLVEDGRLVMVPHLSRLLVIERHDNPYFAKGLVVLEVRVQTGEHADKKLWMPEVNVVRYVRRPEPRPETVPGSNLPRGKARPAPRAAAPRPVDPATRAAATLQLGKNLRFNGNRERAVEYFRRATKEAPGSPAAAEATKILGELGVRP